MANRVRSGLHAQLEAEADELIYQDIQGQSREEKLDVLTPWKEKNRKLREVLVRSGAPDSAVRQGMYNRAYNPRQPHLNSYLGATKSMKMDIAFDPYEGDRATGMGMSTEMQQAVGLDRVDL